MQQKNYLLSPCTVFFLTTGWPKNKGKHYQMDCIYSYLYTKLDFGIPKILFQSLGIEADQKMHQCIETGDDQVREVSVQDESGEQ